jgi:hypothetical protein
MDPSMRLVAAISLRAPFIPQLLAGTVNMIVHDEVAIVRQRQLAIRRELDRRHISLKAVSFDSGLPYGTLLSYFPADQHSEPHGLPVAALNRLVGAIPADMLSLLLPDGWQIVRAPENTDHDEVADAMANYLTSKQHAHHPNSPAGRDIADCEDSDLRSKFCVVVGGRR